MNDRIYLLSRRVRLTQAVLVELPYLNLRAAWRTAGTIQTVALEQMRAES